ncbi:MarR family transcriptional regulator [Clostridium sp. A1-XYC3]|uniref:MarR family transcriptional regulator n=1 Tax=Clostridium tanneri TaxID=3037988 RepID=A0ABU4JNS5_9CLOT|nr:MarR family transcriptional regulator [Clostridium sp. A1-XYC3]MDW8799790.1 MarR family transcriptional regulator [Clostridium sp. A1-XYC3]
MNEKFEHEVEKWVGHWIKIINRNMINIHNQKLEKYGFTVSQLSVLSRLWRQDGLTQKEIAKKLKIKPPSLTGLIDTLVTKGWVVRREDKVDARINRIYLTEEGQELKLKSLEVVDEMEKLICEGFSPEEKLLMLSWLKKLNNNLEQH